MRSFCSPNSSPRTQSRNRKQRSRSDCSPYRLRSRHDPVAAAVAGMPPDVSKRIRCGTELVPGHGAGAPAPATVTRHARHRTQPRKDAYLLRYRGTDGTSPYPWPHAPGSVTRRGWRPVAHRVTYGPGNRTNPPGPAPGHRQDPATLTLSSRTVPRVPRVFRDRFYPYGGGGALCTPRLHRMPRLGYTPLRGTDPDKQRGASLPENGSGAGPIGNDRGRR
jgi:hypothetical protein